MAICGNQSVCLKTFRSSILLVLRGILQINCKVSVFVMHTLFGGSRFEVFNFWLFKRIYRGETFGKHDAVWWLLYVSFPPHWAGQRAEAPDGVCPRVPTCHFLPAKLYTGLFTSSNPDCYSALIQTYWTETKGLNLFFRDNCSSFCCWLYSVWQNHLEA